MENFQEQRSSPKEKIERLGTAYDVSPDNIVIVENKLGGIPSGIIVEVDTQFGRQEVFVSQYIDSDPAKGFTEDWKTLIKCDIILPIKPEDQVNELS